MELYHGDLSPESPDVEKLKFTIKKSEFRSKEIILSRKINEELFNKATNILLEHFDVKIIRKRVDEGCSKTWDFDIQDSEISVETCSFTGTKIYPTRVFSSKPVKVDIELLKKIREITDKEIKKK